METKFTPAPWNINGFNLTQVIKIKDGPDHQGKEYTDGRHQETIADVCPNKDSMTWEEAQANAHLIAAAPDGYASNQSALSALKHVYEVFKMDDTDTAISMQVGMAITQIEKYLDKVEGKL